MTQSNLSREALEDIETMELVSHASKELMAKNKEQRAGLIQLLNAQDTSHAIAKDREGQYY